MAEKDVVLMIADISGYTKFIATNQTTLEHTHKIVEELIKTIIKQVKIPIKVAKLEGDAVFLYCLKNGNASAWKKDVKHINEKLLSFFDVFSSRLRELAESAPCKCEACKNIQELRLKVIVHIGKANFYKIGQFTELSGLDVIIVHRLLKNSLNAREYILLTDNAFKEINLTGIQTKQGTETYKDLGSIKTHAYFPTHHHKHMIQAQMIMRNRDHAHDHSHDHEHAHA